MTISQHFISQFDFSFVSEHCAILRREGGLENDNYNTNLVSINKIQKNFLCVHSQKNSVQKYRRI